MQPNVYDGRTGSYVVGQLFTWKIKTILFSGVIFSNIFARMIGFILSRVPETNGAMKPEA